MAYGNNLLESASRPPRRSTIGFCEPKIGKLAIYVHHRLLLVQYLLRSTYVFDNFNRQCYDLRVIL